jgi:L-rhamnose isomerase
MSYPVPSEDRIQKAYALAKETYADCGVDTDKAIEGLKSIPISLHCWQGDDVGGFENLDALAGGGIQATGNYPGKATTPGELRQDLDVALSLIPGTHRLNLHAMYADTDGAPVERDTVQPEHFDSWIAWAKAKGMGIDFNPSLFAHPKADSGFTLSSRDEGIRQFWVEHCKASRKIGAYIGEKLGTPCVTNVWIPDGMKDVPVDRKTPRDLLEKSLDEVFAEKLNPKHNLDAVECKLFGIGSESYVVGSHEFYMGYAVKNQTLLCLDAGHFHPTEVISDKLTSVLQFVPEVLLHVSRGVRWDSDHVVMLTDELYAIAQEVVRHNFQNRVHIGLDFFDASINRIGAWAMGTRAMCKALLAALLEPTGMLFDLEAAETYTDRLALIEDLKTMPMAAVWDYYCLQMGVPAGCSWLNTVKQYEAEVLSKRG